MALGSFSIKDAGAVTRQIAAEVISSVYHQTAKIVWGADGVANNVSASTPLPVEVIGSSSDLWGLENSVGWADDTVTSAQGLPSIPGDAVRVILSVDGDAIRLKPTGSASGTDGLLIGPGGIVKLGSTHTALTSISIASAGSAKVDCIYLEEPA